MFNERLKVHMTWADVLGTMSLSSEFENIMVRYAYVFLAHPVGVGLHAAVHPAHVPQPSGLMCIV